MVEKGQCSRWTVLEVRWEAGELLQAHLNSDLVRVERDFGQSAMPGMASSGTMISEVAEAVEMLLEIRLAQQRKVAAFAA